MRVLNVKSGLLRDDHGTCDVCTGDGHAMRVWSCDYVVIIGSCGYVMMRGEHITRVGRVHGLYPAACDGPALRSQLPLRSSLACRRGKYERVGREEE